MIYAVSSGLYICMTPLELLREDSLTFIALGIKTTSALLVDCFLPITAFPFGEFIPNLSITTAENPFCKCYSIE